MDFDTSRSGTAPSLPSRKHGEQPPQWKDPNPAASAAKMRPATRSTGTSDIGDINASLRHDRTDSKTAAYSAAVESYREAIFSWGEPSGQEESDYQRTEVRFKHPKSIYAPQQSKPNNFRGGPYSELAGGRLHSKGAEPSSAEVESTDPLGDSAASASGLNMNLINKVANVSAIYGVSKKAKTPAQGRQSIRSRPSSRPCSPITSSGLGSPPKKNKNADGATASNKPNITVSTATVPSGGPKNIVTSPLSQSFTTAQMSNPPALYATERTSPNLPAKSPLSDQLLNEDSSPELTVDTSQGGQTPGPGRNLRPESRKLYLTSTNASTSVNSPSWTGAPPSTTRRLRVHTDAATADMFSGSPPASPSASSPKTILVKSPSLIAGVDHTSSPKGSLSRNKSFPQVRLAPWSTDEAFDQRPPSRQGTAFPFHLAGSDADGDESAANSRMALSGSASTPVILDIDCSPSPGPASSSPRPYITSNQTGPLATPSAATGTTASEKRRASGSSTTSAARPTTRGPGAVPLASSPLSTYVSNAANVAAPPVSIATEWAPVYDPVADGFSDIIPDGPPTFTIEFNDNSSATAPRKPRPLSGRERDLSNLAILDAELGIVETSPRPQVKPGGAGSSGYYRERASSAKGGSGRNVASANVTTKSTPVAPTTVITGGKSQSGHRNVIASPGTSAGKKSNIKDQTADSPTSDDEAYYMSSWAGAKSDKNAIASGSKKSAATLNHPKSAPLSSRKSVSSAASHRHAGGSAWQSSITTASSAGTAATPSNSMSNASQFRNRLRNNVSTSSDKTNRGFLIGHGSAARSSAVSRSRSSSQDADSIMPTSLNTYGASGNFFSSAERGGGSDVPLPKNKKNSGTAVVGPMVISDFEYDDECVTSDEDARVQRSNEEDSCDDVDNQLSEGSDGEAGMLHALSLQSLNLETSLGEDFLSLFAPG